MTGGYRIIKGDFIKLGNSLLRVIEIVGQPLGI